MNCQRNHIINHKCTCTHVQAHLDLLELGRKIRNSFTGLFQRNKFQLKTLFTRKFLYGINFQALCQ